MCVCVCVCVCAHEWVRICVFMRSCACVLAYLCVVLVCLCVRACVRACVTARSSMCTHMIRFRVASFLFFSSA